jgi:hypothetical protein
MLNYLEPCSLSFVILWSESTSSTPSGSTDDDTLDLVSGSLNPTSMDVDEDQIDSLNEERLLRDPDSEHDEHGMSCI